MRSRRAFLKTAGLAGIGAIGGVSGRAFARGGPTVPRSIGTPKSPQSQPAAVSAYSFGSCIWVRCCGRPFTTYRADSLQKYPYFYPVFGPATGLPMTEEAGEQFPHHRSLFLGCDRVNGNNFWQEGLDRGQIVSRERTVRVDRERVIITDACDWRRPEEAPIIEDRRTWVVSAPSADVRIIDADITLLARSDIHVTQTNHSLFSVRAAHELTPSGGGELINSKGQRGEKATFGQAAEWCGFTGRRIGESESIVLMDHPRNPWAPCRWFTRDYGFMSPTPMQWVGPDGWRLPAGESVRLRYRVLVLAGGIDGARTTRLYDEFSKT